MNRIVSIGVAAVGVVCGLIVCAGTGRAAEPASGWDEIGFLNFGGAVKQFEKARGAAEAGSAAWADATLGLALSLHQRQPDVEKDKRRAAELYDELIAATEGQRIQAYALLFRGRLADQIDYFEDKPDDEAAARYYDRLIAGQPSSPLVHQAVLYRAQLGVFSMQPGRVRQALVDLEAWLADHPDNPLASHQWMLVARAYMYPLEKPAEAAAAYRKAETVGLPPTTKLDAYYWRLANLAQAGGDRETAILYYRRIVEEVKRTGFAYEARLRIRELGEEPPPLIDPFATEEP